jgi:hypothetical protein
MDMYLGHITPMRMIPMIMKEIIIILAMGVEIMVMGIMTLSILELLTLTLTTAVTGMRNKKQKILVTAYRNPKPIQHMVASPSPRRRRRRVITTTLILIIDY